MAKIPIYMPKYGMTMTEGLISEWLYAEGDAVQEGRPVVLVETEKVQTELESPASGTLVDVNYQEGQEVPVGKIVAYIEDGK